jgi:hypothetical protein
MEAMKPVGRGLVMLVLVAMGAAALSAADRRPLGEIDFFGYKGLDLGAIRLALPFHEGDSFPPAKVKSDDLKRQSGQRGQARHRSRTDERFIRLLRRQAELHGLYRIARALPRWSHNGKELPGPTQRKGDAYLHVSLFECPALRRGDSVPD